MGRIVYCTLDGPREVRYTTPADFLHKYYRASETLLTAGMDISVDMDGVQEWDDVARLYTTLVDPENGVRVFDASSDANLEAVDKGRACYCWFAIGIMPRYTLEGVDTRVMEAVGRNIRLVPGARDFIEKLWEMAYRPRTFTAAYREAAEEVAKRVGIKGVTATEIETANGEYTGRLKTFIGGEKKKDAILRHYGVNIVRCVDDSWSGLETMEALPSIAFNPKYPSLLNVACVDVHASSLLGVLPLFDHGGRCFDFLSKYPEALPELVVVNDLRPVKKPEWLVREECATASRMREEIGRLVEQELPKAVMVENIRSSLGRYGLEIPRIDMSGIDMEEFKDLALQEYVRVFGC